MDILIKFSEKGNFENICDVKKFFAYQLIQEDQCCHLTVKIATDDIETMYFTYEGKLIAKAKYVDYQIAENNQNFKHAYKLSHIAVFGDEIKVDQNLFKGQYVNYIKTQEQKDFINTVNKSYF